MRRAGLTVKVLRATTGPDDTGLVRARLISRGCRSGKRATRSKRAERETEAQFDLPVEIRNDIARLEIASETLRRCRANCSTNAGAGAVSGVVTGATADTAQPLLAPTFYLARALGPSADVRLAERGSPGRCHQPSSSNSTCR